MDEFALIDRLAAILRRDDDRVELGIGDDAAILAPLGERLVWTVDASVEDVHFRTAWLSFEDVGYRATVAAASDVLAMGATPIAALAALTLPKEMTTDAVEALARGQRAAADALGMIVAGGNVASGPSLSITTTVLGSAERPIGRSGAHPGDRLVMAGRVGEAALGLAALAAETSRAAEAIAAWRRPPVLRAESAALAPIAHAMVDVSDGLAQDVGHLARASGLHAVIDLAALRARRRAPIADAARALGVDLDRLELAGGEDYALVAAVPNDATLPDDVVAIGFLEAGAGVSILRDGARTAPPSGWSHR